MQRPGSTHGPDPRDTGPELKQARAHQQLINTHFTEEAHYWDEVYRRTSVSGAIYRERRAVALTWVDRVGLPPGSRVLEVGCGAGLAAIELARRGWRVEATDSVPAMVDVARRNVAKAGLECQIRVALADVRALQFKDETFPLVLALGVLMWVPAPEQAIQELARVLQPGAHAIVHAANRARLDFALDPLHNPALARLRRTGRSTLCRIGFCARPGGPQQTLHSLEAFDGLLAAAGLEKVAGTTYGFGPFTLLGRKLLPELVGVRLHHALQALADCGVPGIRSRGVEYLVLAQKVGA